MMWVAIVILLSGGGSAITTVSLEDCERYLLAEVQRAPVETIKFAYCQSSTGTDRTYLIKDGKTLP